MARPLHTHLLWLNLHGLVVGTLVLLGSVGLVATQTAGQDTEGDRAPLLDDYAGRYELTPTFILNVMRVGDTLYVQGPSRRPRCVRNRKRSSSSSAVACGSPLGSI